MTNLYRHAKNSLSLLSATLGIMDDILKHELLSYFLLYEYTDICDTIMKCLSVLFAKDPTIELEIQTRKQHHVLEAFAFQEAANYSSIAVS